MSHRLQPLHHRAVGVVQGRVRGAGFALQTLDAAQHPVAGREFGKLTGLRIRRVDFVGLETIEIDLLSTQFGPRRDAFQFGPQRPSLAVRRREGRHVIPAARAPVQQRQLVRGLQQKLMVVLTVNVHQPFGGPAHHRRRRRLPVHRQRAAAAASRSTVAALGREHLAGNQQFVPRLDRLVQRRGQFGGQQRV